MFQLTNTLTHTTVTPIAVDKHTHTNIHNCHSYFSWQNSNGDLSNAVGTHTYTQLSRISLLTNTYAHTTVTAIAVDKHTLTHTTATSISWQTHVTSIEVYNHTHNCISKCSWQTHAHTHTQLWHQSKLTITHEHTTTISIVVDTIT